MLYNINGLQVDVKKGVVINGSKKIAIRSKTLQVLVMLIDKKHRVVTKQELLNSIWHDVIVQEQVLAQSVKELRDLLGSDIIKTFPRNGYQWVADLEQPLNRQKNHLTQVLMAVVAVFVTMSILFFVKEWGAKQPTVAFLPVHNAMQDKDHHWVSVQGLEYTNQRLMQASELDVVSSGHILYALERLDVEKRSTFDGGDIYPLREKLEADIVVKTRLTGFPMDYQLHYFVYSDHNVERGVITDKTVRGALDQIVAKVAGRFGSYHPDNFNFKENVFSNEAFARGMELYLQNRFEQAAPLFLSALHSDSRLLAARRYLAASYANTARQAEAIALLEENIQQASTQHNRELIRAYLLIGYLKINWPTKDDREGELLMATQYIEKAKQLAEQQQDRLFIAYAYEELGKIKRLQGQYTQSVRLLTAALSYHLEFNSTYGQTAALIELAKVAAEQRELQESDQYLQRALEIAQKSDAQANLVWVYLAKADIARSQVNEKKAWDFAKKAQEIALHSDNALLVNRVEAWFNHASVYSVN